MKTQHTASLGLAFVITGILLCFSNCRPPDPIPYAFGPDGPRYHNKTFLCTNIVDGDTMDLAIPDGDSPYTRIRLLGVDTPETKHPRMPVQYYGPEATRRVEQLLTGQHVTVLLDARSDIRCKYGRLLAYLVLPDARLLNEVLLIEGFAYADPRFPHSRLESFLDLEYDARTNSRGLWQHVTYEQLPSWYRDLNTPGQFHQSKD